MMRVRDNRPNNWFLIEAGESLIFDVNCCHSYFNYSFSMILSDAERECYFDEGGDYLDRLADSIQTSAPIAKRSTSIYKSRSLGDEHSDAISVAIANWRARENGHAE